MTTIRISDPDDSRLDPYRDLPTSNPFRDSKHFIAEGDKVVDRLIASGIPIESVLVDSRFHDRLSANLAPETPIFVIERELIEQVVGFRFHRGFLARGVRQPSRSLQEILPSSEAPCQLLVVSEIQDPTNLGTIIRSAAAFGIEAIVLGPKSADAFSRRVIRVSMGAVFHIPLVRYESEHQLVQELEKHSVAVVGTTLEANATDIRDFVFPRRLAIILGNEGHGLAEDWNSICHHWVTIPMAKKIDSLNASVAAGVFLYAAWRSTARRDA